MVILYLLFFPENSFADNLYREGELYDAITEYRRLIYLYPESSEVARWNKMVVLSYMRMGKYREAEGFYTKAEISDKKLSHISMLLKYGTIIMEDSTDFERLLYAYSHFTTLPGTTLVNLLSFLNDDIRMAILSAKKRLRSPEKARLISLLFPGAGMVYAGNLYEGTLSFLVNGSLLFLTSRALMKKRYIDALLIVQFGLIRFYSGGASRSYTLAERRNESIRNKLFSYIFREYLKAHPEDSLYIDILYPSKPD